MEKILKKYTTIPSHLYVNREADRQLKNIVMDMQRPGYVLVARQMGKTNLLFNAKRTMENDNRLFAYVDMSNVFKKERECYQNIIDCLIEPNEDVFPDSIEEKIEVLRHKGLPPHKEYTKSLRIILDAFVGDIVIILDEIDALKSVDYSDNIFAQIRSNYFSRTNFPEFERLTYILSGVIEPIELIKDRNKSPFNIGDKIYLDDFSKKEFLNFIEMSELSVEPELSELIFEWSRGNPRLTFDICSEVESYILDGKFVDSQVLNDIIKDKYLTTFDHAPIDHIRELVKSNNSICDAIVNIHASESTNYSDDIKKKLYLFGIITSKFNEKIDFKNPIIKKSLSIEWIESIRENNWSEVDGFFFINKANYKKSVEIFKYLIANESDKNPVSEDARYFLGFSYYHLGKIKEAIGAFSYEFKKSRYKSRAICLGGVCKIKQGLREEGMAELKKVTNDSDNFTSHNALLNLARSLEDEQFEKALELLDLLDQSLCNDNDDNDDDDDYNNLSIKVAMFYSRFEIYMKIGDKDKAFKNLSESLVFLTPSEMFSVKLDMYSIFNDENSKNDLISIVIDNKLIFNNDNELGINFNRSNLVRCLSHIYSLDNNESFNKLLDYSVKHLGIDGNEKHELLFDAATYGTSKIPALKELVSSKEEINKDIQLKVYRKLAIESISNTSEFIHYFTIFNQLSKSKVILIEYDLYLYSLALQEIIKLEMIHNIIEITKDIEHRLSLQPCQDTLLLTSSLILFWKGVAHARLGQMKIAIEYFKKVTNIIDDSKFTDTVFLTSRHFSSIHGFENKIKPSLPTQNIFTQPKKFNESNAKKYSQKQMVTVEYKDGTRRTGKYKRFNIDIKSQQCKVLTP